MNFLRKILDNMKPHFTDGGKLRKLYPAFDAFETFLFVPNHTTSSKCHIRDSIDLKRTMATVIIALIPCLIFGCYNVGVQHFSQLNIDLGFFKAILEENGKYQTTVFDNMRSE